MGFFKKLGRSIGKVFKSIGNFIKRGWGKFNKWMNSLGIFGQMGMMFINANIATAALSGMKTLGSNFMVGLKAGGWADTASEASPFGARSGLPAGAARAAYAIMHGVAKAISFSRETAGAITRNLVGVVGDTVKMLGRGLDRVSGNRMGFSGVKATAGAEKLLQTQGLTGDPKLVGTVTDGRTLKKATQWDLITTNVSDRFKTGIGDVGTVVRETGEVARDVIKREYKPDYQKFTDRDGTVVRKEINYSKENLDEYLNSPEYKATPQYLEMQAEFEQDPTFVGPPKSLDPAHELDPQYQAPHGETMTELLWKEPWRAVGRQLKQGITDPVGSVRGMGASLLLGKITPQEDPFQAIENKRTRGPKLIGQSRYSIDPLLTAGVQKDLTQEDHFDYTNISNLYGSEEDFLNNQYALENNYQQRMELAKNPTFRPTYGYDDGFERVEQDPYTIYA